MVRRGSCIFQYLSGLKQNRTRWRPNLASKKKAKRRQIYGGYGKYEQWDGAEAAPSLKVVE
jgi:hypothetical protein